MLTRSWETFSLFSDFGLVTTVSGRTKLFGTVVCEDSNFWLWSLLLVHNPRTPTIRYDTIWETSIIEILFRVIKVIYLLFCPESLQCIEQIPYLIHGFGSRRIVVLGTRGGGVGTPRLVSITLNFLLILPAYICTTLWYFRWQHLKLSTSQWSSCNQFSSENVTNTKGE